MFKYSLGILSGRRETSALARIVYIVYLFMRANIIDFRILFVIEFYFIYLNLRFVLYLSTFFLSFSYFFKGYDGLRILVSQKR